ESANLIEYFVHTEDVRRAVDRWAPRALDEEYSDALWDELVKRAAILYRGVDLGIVLVRPSGPRHVAKRAPVSVAIVGEPGELLMHAHGRTRHALVTFEGQPDAVALLQSAEVGL
ncbi:MAG: TIGR03085 family protein, partial [Arthrobacter sp.]